MLQELVVVRSLPRSREFEGYNNQTLGDTDLIRLPL